MSNPFVFLVVPVVVVLVASLVTWLRGRRPTTLSSGIDGFQREMRALSPDGGPAKPRRVDPAPPPGRPASPPPRDR